MSTFTTPLHSPLTIVKKLVDGFHNHLLNGIDNRADSVLNGVYRYRKSRHHEHEKGISLDRLNEIEDHFLGLMKENMEISTHKSTRLLYRKVVASMFRYRKEIEEINFRSNINNLFKEMFNVR